MVITGGGKAPTPATMAVVVIRPQAEVEDDDGLPVVFPVEDPVVFPDLSVLASR